MTEIGSQVDQGGDKNTKFFHSMTNHHKMINYVEEMEIDGLIVKGNEHLRQGVRKFFCMLHEKEFSRRPKLDGINFRILDEMSRVSLKREFTKEEAFDELTHRSKDKALGFCWF